MSLPLTQVQLDMAGCASPECSHEHDHTVLFLHPGCHPSAGTRDSYDKRTGVLTIACRRCKSMVAQIKVAAS